jgi:hypothetical protein
MDSNMGIEMEGRMFFDGRFAALRRNMVGRLGLVVGLLSGVLLSSDPVLAATTRSTVMVGANAITVDTRLTFPEYKAGSTMTLTVDYFGTCNLVFSGLALRSPQPFAPPSAVSGGIGNVTGTPHSGSAHTSGSVTFDITFYSLQNFGAKLFGVASLNLMLGVDADCNPHSGDSDGVDQSTTVGVQVLVVAVPPPPPPKPPGYVSLGIDPNTHLAIFECDQANGPAPGVNYYLAGISGTLAVPPSRGQGLPIYAPIGAQPAAVTAAIQLTGGVAVH